MVILRAETQLEVPDRTTLQTYDSHQDGSEDVYVLCVGVVPCLTGSVERPSTVDVDVVPADLPECGGVLEGQVE